MNYIRNFNKEALPHIRNIAFEYTNQLKTKFHRHVIDNPIKRLFPLPASALGTSEVLWQSCILLI